MNLFRAIILLTLSIGLLVGLDYPYCGFSPNWIMNETVGDIAMFGFASSYFFKSSSESEL